MGLFKKKYKEYPLINREYNGIYQYFLKIYSGEKELLLLLDSGASLCNITEEALEGCKYILHDGTSRMMIADGSYTETKLATLSVSLIDERGRRLNNQFLFNVSPKEVINPFGVGVAGLLGSTFLRFCNVDFFHGKLRLYY